MKAHIEILSIGLHTERLRNGAKLALPASKPSGSPNPSRYVLAAVWENDTGCPISSFRTSFLVPDEPTSIDKQLIYIFPGLQNHGANAHIVQPVLQWGINSDGIGFNSWMISSWCVETPEKGGVMRSNGVKVSPGTMLTAVVTLLRSDSGNFSYECEFEGFAETKLSVPNSPELKYCVQAIETYRVNVCSEYPRGENITMSNIALESDHVNLSPNWSIYPSGEGKCGQHIVVLSDSDVELIYRG